MPTRATTIRPPREDRLSRSKRGYTRRWYAYRMQYLADNPACQWPGCSEPATDIDHITPINGGDDPLFWDVSNHQGLCHHHHSVKTTTVDRKRRAKE